MTQSKSKEYRQHLAEMFTHLLEEKALDWKKEWNGLSNRPVNAVKGNKYKGINVFHLMLVMLERGYTDPRFATFNQIKEKGWKLQDAKGKGIQVEYWFPYDKEAKKAITWAEFKLMAHGRPDDRYVLHSKYSTVFNAEHIVGIPELAAPQKNEIAIDELVDKLSSGMEVEIINDGGDRAFYRPSEDKIHLPLPEAFNSDYAYNSTAFHELAHATGAAKRLNRILSGGFGSASYAFEELVAEITSCFMSVHLSVEQDEKHIENHKAYVQSWLSEIREKPEMLVKAIAEAEKASSYMEHKAGLIPEQEYKEVLQASYEIPSLEERINQYIGSEQDYTEDFWQVPMHMQIYERAIDNSLAPEEARTYALLVDLAEKDLSVEEFLSINEELKNSGIDIADVKKEPGNITWEAIETLIDLYTPSPEDISRSAAKKYRAVTSEHFHKLNGEATWLDCESAIREYITNRIEQEHLDIEIVDVVLYGSRSRGLENPDSDIDFVVEYKGEMKEDSLFNILNHEVLRINNIDIKIDINPIRAEETGTLADYLPKAEAYLKEKRDRLEAEMMMFPDIEEDIRNLRAATNNLEKTFDELQENIARLTPRDKVPEVVGLEEYLKENDREKEVYQQLKQEKIRIAQKNGFIIETNPIPMDLEDYLRKQGVGSPVGEYQDDKIIGRTKILNQLSTKKDYEAVSRDYWERRESAKKEYQEMVESGQVRPLSEIERTLKKANGHPDNPSTQAARRMAEKRGFDWKTGQRKIQSPKI